MTRKVFAPLIILVLVLGGIVLCFFNIKSSKEAVSVDITNVAYCEDVLSQMSNEVTSQTTSVEEVIDFSNSFLLYNFAEEQIAIFYKIRSINQKRFINITGNIIQSYHIIPNIFHLSGKYIGFYFLYII